MEDSLRSELDGLRGDGLYRSLRVVASAQGRLIHIDGKQSLNFSSNDYLGLANDPRLKDAARVALGQYGVGAGASRLVCGNLEPYDRLERALAEFKRKEAAIVFSSGYTANVGTICSISGPDDVVIIDKLCHASIIDGCRQSGAILRVYPHKNLTRLEELLRHSASRARRVLVITETVYSMDGDVAPLREIAELKDRYNAWLMIDEAHATGVFGANGRGVAEHMGIEDRVDITLGTLSKAFGCVGGYVVGSQTLIDFLCNKARSLIYSTALPPSMVAAATEAVGFMRSDEARSRREALWRNVTQMKAGLAKLGFDVQSSSTILPIIIGEERRAVALSLALLEMGIFVSAIRFPTVAKGKARLRVTVTADHQAEDITHFVDQLSHCRST